MSLTTLVPINGMLATLLILTAATTGGCASSRDWPQTEQAAAQATGAADAIQLDVNGQPVDIVDAIPSTLTLPDAIQRALRYSPTIQVALARARAAQAEAHQARLLPNPILSVAVRFPEGGGTPTIDAGLTADLVSLLSQPGRISAADHRLRAAGAEAVTAALDVLQDVQERYAAVQMHDELMPILEARRELLARLLDISQSRFRAGEGTQLDALTLNAQLVELELEIAEKQSERREERLALARLIGQPSAEPSWQVSPWQPPETMPGAEKNWISAAMDNRPEIQARRWELAAMGDDLAAGGWASLDGAEAGVDSEKEGDWAVGPAVSVPIPLLDWGQARRAKRHAERIEARHHLAQEQRRVVEEVRSAHGSLVVALEMLQRVSRELIPLAERRQTQAEAQYKAGQTDITSLVLAAQELQSARARLIELQQRTSTALARLHRAVGGSGVATRMAPSSQPATEQSELNSSK